MKAARLLLEWNPLMRFYYGTLALLFLWSLGSLLFYRAPTSLGRAAIGDETIHFGLPLLLAFFVSILGFGLSHPATLAAKAAPFGATIVLAIVEAFIYLRFVF
jgi:hypothetical protein